MTLYNFVYATPCDGKVTGMMRLSRDGHAEMLPYQNLGRKASLHPDVPTGDWLEMPNLGNFKTPAEMCAILNERPGWSLVEMEE